MVARQEDLVEDAVHLLVKETAAHHWEAGAGGPRLQFHVKRVGIRALDLQPRHARNILDDKFIGDRVLRPHVRHGARVVSGVLHDHVAHPQLVLQRPDPVREPERVLRPGLSPNALQSAVAVGGGGAEGLARQNCGLASVDVDGRIHGKQGRRALCR